MLPRALDFEVFEIGGFGFVDLVLDELVNAAAAGAFFERGAEFVEVFRWADGEDLDVAGVGVAHPAAKAELGGFAVDEPTKADALDAAADEEVKDHRRRFSVSYRSVRNKRREEISIISQVSKSSRWQLDDTNTPDLAARL